MAKTNRKKSETSIQDIPHEHVETQAAAPVASPTVQEAEVIDDEKALAITINKEIKRFNLADAAIAQMKEQYGALVINGVDDKDGYKAVKAAWNEVRSKRTGLEKKGLEIRADYNKITKAVKSEEDRLVEAIEPLEDDLYRKWKAIDDEKEAEKKRKEQEEQARLGVRIDAMLAEGAGLSNGYYGIGGTIAVDVATIRTMTDDQFNDLLGAVKNKAAELRAEADRLAEQKRKEDEDRLAAQKKLDDDAAALKKQQDDFKLQQEQFEQQKREMARQRREMRLDALQALGMTISAGGKEVAYNNGFGQHIISMDEIDAASDAEFKTMFVTATQRVGDAKQKLDEHEKQVEAETRARELRKKEINDIMIPVGFAYNYNGYFSFANDFLHLKKTMDELLAMDAEDLKAAATNWAIEIDNAKQKQQERQQEQDAQRERERQAQLGDATNFEEYINRVLNVELPEMKSDQYKEKIGGFYEGLDILAKKFLPEKEEVA